MRIPGSADLATSVSALIPSARRELPIRDTTQDPGLFGPGSVTWRVMAEPRLMFGAGRALLMQAAHPLIAEGAIDHSTYATDPFGRFERTVEWVTVMCFGTVAEARAAARGVNRLHAAVSGALAPGHGTAAISEGTPYTARDGQLLRWVHATFVDTMVVTHDAFVGGLTRADRDLFVREWHAVGRLMGVPRRGLWNTYAELAQYVQREQRVRGGPARPGAGSRLVAATILRPPVASAVARPGWALVTFATLGLLPPSIRRAYGVSWTPAHEAGHRALALALRSGSATLPRRLRVSPVYDRAMARSQGRLAPAA